MFRQAIERVDLDRSAADFHARNGPSGRTEIDRIVFDGDYYMAWGAEAFVPRPSDAWLEATARSLWPIVGNGHFRLVDIDPKLVGLDRWQVAWVPT